MDENNQNERKKRSQQVVFEKLLSELEERHLTREHIKVRFLSGKSSAGICGVDVVTLLDLLDAVRESLKTSLQFGDYRRALRYLVLLDFLCESTSNN